jgi:N,N'-diacetylchitobiose phosphorylase
MSWTNYLGTEDLVGVFNQTAGGYLFFKSAERHRITRFRANSVPLDRPGHYVYLRDEESGDYWTISWQPVAKPVECYRARHGLSYTVYSCEYSGLYAEQRLFIPRGEDVELWDIVVENRSGRDRKIGLYSYAELSFHLIDSDNKNFQSTLYCSGADYEDGVIEQDLHYEDQGYQFFASDFDPDGVCVDREKFIGVWNTEANPEALVSGTRLSVFSIRGGNQSAVLYKSLSLCPGEIRRHCFMLGEGGKAEGRRIKNKFAGPVVRDAAFIALKEYWDRKRSALRVLTPNESMNTMLNIWTLYQSEINVMFSRFASFIEVGGRTGLGYRDTSQDAMCVIHSNPEKCRSRIVELLKALMSEGYGLHLFEPEWFDEKKEAAYRNPTIAHLPDITTMLHSAENACSDDALWLVSTVVEYIRETGDAGFAGVILPYADTVCMTPPPPSSPQDSYLLT